MSCDLVLSSGFLAFARHVGVLSAVEERGVVVQGICGTSSGALVGALFAAGMPPSRIADELSARAPLAYLRPHFTFWSGAFGLERMVTILEGWLPPTFEALDRPFGVGVIAPGRECRLITTGSLPLAVAASCAIPWLFAPIVIDGVPLQDGGVTDRTFLQAWRAHRPQARLVAHVVDRTAGALDEPGLEHAAIVIRTPRSGARFWNLGDFAGQVEEARRLSIAALG